VQDANDALATAQGIVEDPNCVTEAVASQAAAEGARRVGAAANKMLGKIGITSTGRQAVAPAPAANPCKTAGTAAAAGTVGTVPNTPNPVGTVPTPAPTVSRPRLGTTNASGGRNCGALGAGCADGMKPMVACYDEKKGWLWKVLADSIEQKRDSTAGLAPDQLNDINADVAALRRAHADGAPRVEVVDPARPDRYNTWLTGPGVLRGSEQGQHRDPRARRSLHEEILEVLSGRESARCGSGSGSSSGTVMSGPARRPRRLPPCWLPPW
jgi:hypothetical protein